MPTGLVPDSGFGIAQINNMLLSPTGIGSVQVVGTPLVTMFYAVTPNGVDSLEAMGNPWITKETIQAFDVVFTARLAPRNKVVTLADPARVILLDEPQLIALLAPRNRWARLMRRQKIAHLAEPVRTQE
jgi:hypothetical protein